ncbi:MAG: Gfo/Idh/MocA family protein [Thermoguttaceae bacterium]
MQGNTLSRRGFLQRSTALAAAGAAVPYFFSSQVAKAKAANDRLGVGSIGTGGQGSGIGHGAAGRGEMRACADVDLSHAERFAQRYEGRCAVYQDYRKVLERDDIQVVTIGTPDHWHTKIAIEAMLAGKHIYCEKPLTLTIEEGQLICKVAKQTGVVFQVGSQQRSDRGRFLTAVALARSGRLGKTLTATCSLGGGPSGGPFPTADPPAHLDWNAWLGQCPVVPYTPQRCHGNFRWWLEYSGGKLTDWGAHHVDIAQWGLGHETTGPVEIEGEGNFPNIPDDFDPVAFYAGKQEIPNGFNTATTFKVTAGFADGAKMIIQHGPDNGVWFEGDKGRIFVNRGRITGKPIEELTDADREWLAEETAKLYKGAPFQGGHIGNFFWCIENGGEPVSDVFTHHRAVSTCHMANHAMLLGRKLRWDPAKEDFLGDDAASALVARPRRAPYDIKI